VGILFGTGIRGATAVDLGRAVVKRYGGLRGLARPEPAELAAERGVGTARAARLSAGLELARRLAAEPLVRGVRLDGPEAVRRHFGPLLADLSRERLYAVLLDRRHRVIREHLVCEGTLDEAPVHPREVFIPALREAAAAVIVVHNHPSGDPTPSEADYAVTARLVLAGRALGVPLLDHVVVAGDGSVSLAAEQGGEIDALCPADRLLASVNEPKVRYVAPPRGSRSPPRAGVSP
jgi:DNA repair protein RadC